MVLKHQLHKQNIPASDHFFVCSYKIVYPKAEILLKYSLNDGYGWPLGLGSSNSQLDCFALQRLSDSGFESAIHPDNDPCSVNTILILCEVPLTLGSNL